MVTTIKNVLREELENSLRMQASYERELQGLPIGSLVRRVIKGNEYYYLVFREKGKVRSVYRGRPSEDELQRYREYRSQRIRFRQLLSATREQIRFLKKVLRGKSPT